MAITATANIDINVSVVHSNPNDLGQYNGSPGIDSSLTFSTSDLSKVFADSRSISAADPLDVTSGLTDQYGTALVYATVKTVVIKNTHATATLTIGGGSDPLYGTDQYTLKAGQTLPITSSATVDGTHKVLTITPSVASTTYDILILGS